MPSTKALIDDFLAQKSIAIAGVSVNRETPANGIFTKMINAGYTVYPVHPVAESFRDHRCYSSLGSIDPRPDGVILVTRPEITSKLIDDCIRSGIPRVWIHNMMGTLDNKKPGSLSSVDTEAVIRGREAGLRIISGSCPMQFVPPVDVFHRCIRWISDKTGRL
jgi:uncharacterized protein